MAVAASKLGTRMLAILPVAPEAKVPLLTVSCTAAGITAQTVARALAVANRGYVLQFDRVLEQGEAGALRDNPRIRETFPGG